MKQKQTHRDREQTCGCEGESGGGRGSIGCFGLADVNQYIQNR